MGRPLGDHGPFLCDCERGFRVGNEKTGCMECESMPQGAGRDQDTIVGTRMDGAYGYVSTAPLSRGEIHAVLDMAMFVSRGGHVAA